MPNPREVYKQRAQEQSAEQQSSQQEGEEQESAQSTPAEQLVESAPEQMGADSSSEQLTDNAPDQVVADAASEQQAAEAASSEQAAEVSPAQEPQPDEAPKPTTTPSTSQDLKGKPSPRRGKVEQKVDRHVDAKIQAAKRANRKRIIKKLIITVLIVAIVAAVGTFVYLRWFEQDDAQNFTGKWQISGSEGTIEITDTKIILNDEVSYEYALDPTSKTLSFTFGSLEGNARYRLSFDGNQLSITDGEYDFMSTLIEDAPWMMGALVNPAENPPTLGEESMLLERVE